MSPLAELFAPSEPRERRPQRFPRGYKVHTTPLRRGGQRVVTARPAGTMRKLKRRIDRESTEEFERERLETFGPELRELYGEERPRWVLYADIHDLEDIRASFDVPEIFWDFDGCYIKEFMGDFVETFCFRGDISEEHRQVYEITEKIRR